MGFASGILSRPRNAQNKQSVYAKPRHSMEGVFLGSRWQNIDGYRLGALVANHDGSPQLLVRHDVPNDGQI